MVIGQVNRRGAHVVDEMGELFEVPGIGKTPTRLRRNAPSASAIWLGLGEAVTFRGSIEHTAAAFANLPAASGYQGG